MKRFIAVIALLLLAPFAGAVPAGDPGTLVKERLPIPSGQPGRTLRVGIDRNAAPMEYEKEGTPKGFNVDIMKAIADEAGFDVRFVFLPWTEVLESVRSGNLDVMFALDTPERRQNYAFTRPILDITWRIFVREETYGISSLEHLETHTVSVVKGFASHSHLLEKELDMHIVAVDTVPEALELLARGEVFAFFGQYHLALYYLQLGEFRGIKVIGDVIDVKPFAIAVKKGNSRLLKALDVSLDALYRKGEHRRVYEKWYGGETISKSVTLKRILPFVYGLLGGFLLLGLWTYTLRKKVRDKTRELSENLAKFQKFTEKSPFPLAIVSADGRFEYVNPGFTRAYGYAPGEIPDTDTWFRTMYPDPDYRDTIIREWNRILGERRDLPDPLTYTLVNKRGEAMIVAFRVLNLGDGRVIVIMEDTTARRELENERLRQEQIESISLLAGGIAHDFNNILMNLIGYINLMQMEQGQSAERMETLVKMEKSIQRATAITGQLMTFSRGGAPVRTAQAIEPLILESVHFVLHGSPCVAETSFAPDIPPIEIDSAQIYQTLNNLFINAIHAMPDGGTIGIRVDTFEIGPGPGGGDSHLLLDPGNYLRIEIRDSGVGISPEAQTRIFTPYFTTKEKGSGLGLTTAYSIVRKHGGTIDFKSVPGKGTVFTVYLPYSGSATPAREDETEIPVRNYSMNALVMDDEESILEILKKMLERLGFTVTTVKDGEGLVSEYIDAARSGRRYDLVITDLTIPGGTGGREAAKALREFDPDALIVISSGYSSDQALGNFRAHGFRGVLKKPYTFQNLQGLIQSIFAGR